MEEDNSLSNKLVSIIIPFHNAGNYILECINCLLKQDYKNFEAIFVDDGSTDNSVEIIERNIDCRFKVFKLQKSGVSFARNFGISKANGYYISFMDVDDIIDSDFILQFVTAIEENNCQVVICDYRVREKNQKKYCVSLPWENTILENKSVKEQLIPKMIYSKNEEIRGLVWRTFTTKEFIELHTISFINEIEIGEDLLFTIQLYLKAERIFILSRATYEYVQNSNSTLHKYKDFYLDKQQIFFKYLKSILESEEVFIENSDSFDNKKAQMYAIAVANACKLKKFRSCRAELKSIKLAFQKENFKSITDIDKSSRVVLIFLRSRLYFILFIVFKLRNFIKWGK